MRLLQLNNVVNISVEEFYNFSSPATSKFLYVF